MAGRESPRTRTASQPSWAVVIIAHRGGLVPEYPENTLMAFRQTIETGAEVIEIDLRSTQDGDVVVLHDRTLDRTTDGEGAVVETTLSDLRLLAAGMGQTIPTYEEVLELVSGTNTQLLLDLKVTSYDEVRKIVRLTEKHGLVLNVIVAARSLDELRTIQSLNPNLRTLAFMPRRDQVEAYAAAGADIIRLFIDWIREDPDLVAKVHSLGRAIWTTSLTAPREELEELMEYGVNGFLTDFPKMIAQLRVELKDASGEIRSDCSSHWVL